MLTVHGIYVTSLFFNSEKGQSTFLLKPEPGSCQDYVSEHGNIKVVGRFCLEQKNMPLAIDGDWHTSEYGPELHIRNIVETSCTKQETVDFIRELNAVISPRDIRRIAGIVGGDIFSASENLSMEEKICSKTKADFVSVSDVFKKVRRLKRELDLFKFLGEYNGTYEHCMKLMKKYPTDALEMVLHKPYEVARNVNIPFHIMDRIALDQGQDSTRCVKQSGFLLQVWK